MSSSSAADLIQGAMYQFEMSDTVENLNRIVDVVEKISASTGVEFKRSIEQISEGIQTTGAMAYESGYNIEQYSALIGGLVEKTRRNGSELANSVKMIFARLGQNKEGDATDEEISNSEKAYKKIGISLRDGTDSFRDLPEVFAELNEKWKTMSDVEKAYIAEISAGNRNRSVFMAMMNGYDKIAQLTEDAYNAEGYAEEANEARMESFETKLEQLKASAEGFWNNLTNADGMKVIVDFATNIVSLLDQLINKTPVLSGAIRGLLAAFAIKTIPGFLTEMSNSDSAIGALLRTMKSAVPNFKEYQKALNNFANVDKNDMNSIFEAFKGDGDLKTKKLLAKAVGIDDEQIQKAVQALESGVAKIEDSVPDNAMQIEIPASVDMEQSDMGNVGELLDQLGIDELRDAVEDAAEVEIEPVVDTDQVSDILGDIADQEIELSDSGIEIGVDIDSDAVEEVGSVADQLRESLADDTDDGNILTSASESAQEWLDLADEMDASTAAVDAQANAELREAAATAQSTVAQTADTAATQADTAAVNAQTAAQNGNNVANATGAAGDVAHTATQVALGQAIDITRKKLLAQAVAWAATPAGMLTIAATAIGLIGSIAGAVKSANEEVQKNAEEAFNSATEAVEKYRSEMEDLENSEEKVLELSTKFRRLSKGVSENGYRVSLTREQYEEYKEVVSQIAELMPELVDGYNSEGIALINLGETIDDTKKKYIELAKEKAKAFVDENRDNILAANRDQYDDDDDFTAGEDRTQQIEYIDSFLDAYRLYKSNGKDMSYINNWFWNHNDPYITKEAFSSAFGDLWNLSSGVNGLLMLGIDEEATEQWIDEQKNTILKARESVNSLILAELKTRDEYYSFSSAQGEMLDALLSDLGGGRDPLGVYRMLSDNVVSVESLSEMVLDWLTGEDTSNLVSKKDELDKQYNDGLMTISDYQKKMGELKEAATQAVGDSQLGGLFTGMFNVDDAVKARKDAISSLGDSSVKIANIFDPGKYQWDTDAQKALERLLNDFSTEDIEVMARLDINPEWDEVDLKNEIKLEKLRMKKYAKENFSFLDTGYIENINITYSGGSIEELIRDATRLSKNS